MEAWKKWMALPGAIPFMIGVMFILIGMADLGLISQVGSFRALAWGGFALGALAYAGRIVLAQSKEEKVLMRVLDLLGKSSPSKMINDQPSDLLRSLAPGSIWRDPVEKVGQNVVSLVRQMEQIEHGRKSLELKIRRHTEDHERIQKVFQAVTDPILAVDESDHLFLANAGAEKLLGIDPNFMEEQKTLESVLECKRLVELMLDSRRRKISGLRVEELDLNTPSGEMKHYQARISNIPSGRETDVKGNVEGSQFTVAVLHEAGQEKAIQQRHAEFVSAVSHEMKAPLAGIKAYVEMLADGDAPDETTQEEFLSIIGGQANRLERLVENLLNMARIEAGVVKVKKERQSLNGILEEAFQVVQPTAHDKGIKLISELSPMYLDVFVDRDMLLQGAINLLSNAVKYTAPQGAVTLSSRLMDREVQFSVEDTGVGLSEEDSRRIFEKFYRVEKDSKMASGTGLGLPLAKQIVEDVHGGIISVKSVQGKGSTFIVTLPRVG